MTKKAFFLTKIIQKIPKVCFTCINKLSIHAYFALISKCELFYIKPFAYRKFMFCNIVGKHQIDVFLRFLNYAAYLTDNETSLPLNAHWTQTSNPYKALHVKILSRSQEFSQKYTTFW